MLPEYDNALLSYADRSRFFADVQHSWERGGPGGYIGSVLVDGLVQATWAIRPKDGAASLEVRQSVPLSPSQRAEIELEARQLMRFVIPYCSHEVLWTSA